MFKVNRKALIRFRKMKYPLANFQIPNKRSTGLSAPVMDNLYYLSVCLLSVASVLLSRTDWKAEKPSWWGVGEGSCSHRRDGLEWTIMVCQVS